MPHSVVPSDAPINLSTSFSLCAIFVQLQFTRFNLKLFRICLTTAFEDKIFFPKKHRLILVCSEAFTAVMIQVEVFPSSDAAKRCESFHTLHSAC